MADVETEPDYGTAIFGRARCDEMRLDTLGGPGEKTGMDVGWM